MEEDKVKAEKYNYEIISIDELDLVFKNISAE
jgi:hypothetical protein